MKILFVGMYPDEYSPYRNVFFQNLIYAMADAGIECTVISPVPVTRYRKKIRDVSRYRIDTTPKGSKVYVYHPRYISLSSKKFGPINTGIYSENIFQNCAMKEALRIVKKSSLKFDAIYGHFFLSGGLAAIKIGNVLNVPSFIANGECNYDTEIVNLYRELDENDLNGLSGIIAVSTNNLNVLNSKEIFRNIPKIVAPNSVDMSLFYRRSKNECREKLGFPNDKFIVGFVGGFIERKGDKRLLEAINSIDGVYGAFAGKGENKPSGEKVIFCDALNHEEIPLFLNAIDIFCLPTLNEGSCNAIVEAASCGVPVISSNLPFNDDLLTNENSIRIDPNSVHEIREAIVLLYENMKFREELEERIFESSRGFDINVREKKIESFIRNIIENNYDEDKN